MHADLDRIAFVARSYNRLRIGIVNVVYLPFVVLALQSLRADDYWSLSLWIIAGMGVGVAGAMGVDRWLSRRFGRVVAASPEVSRWNPAWTPALVGAGFSILSNVDRWALTSGKPSFTLLVVGAVCLWLTIRDWPFRKHVALAFAACCTGALVMPILPADSLPLWRPRIELLVTGAWMTVVMLDLAMLERVLRPDEASSPLAVESRREGHDD